MLKGQHRSPSPIRAAEILKPEHLAAAVAARREALRSGNRFGHHGIFLTNQHSLAPYRPALTAPK